MRKLRLSKHIQRNMKIKGKDMLMYVYVAFVKRVKFH